MAVMIILLLMIEFSIVMGFIYLITGMKNPNPKPFYKLYDFWGIISCLGILILLLIFLMPKSNLYKEAPSFSIEISRDNEFEIIDILDELSKKDKKGKEVYIRDYITVTYNNVGQIADINMGVYIPKSDGYKYYYSDLNGDKLVFTQSRGGTGELTIDYCKTLMEEYHTFIKDIECDKVTYSFKKSNYEYISLNDGFILSDNKLTKIERNHVIERDCLMVSESIYEFNLYDFVEKNIRNIII